MKGYEPSVPVGREFLSASVYDWLQLQLGVRYARDPQKVTAILLGFAALHPDVLHEPPPEVIFNDLGDSSPIFPLRIWTAK